MSEGTSDAPDRGAVSTSAPQVFTRLHPVAAISNTLAFIRGNLIPLLLLVLVGGRNDDPTSLPLILAGVAAVFVVGILRWLKFTYLAEPGRLQIRSGVIVRREMSLPRERIQVMEVVEGFVERMAGLVSLRIQTGSQEAAVVLTTLTRQEARRIMELVHPEQAMPAEAGTSPDQGEPGAGSTILHKPDARTLWLAAATSGGIGVFFSILGTLFTQVDQFIDVEGIVEWLTGWIPQVGASIWVSLFLTLLVLSWMFSVAGFMLTHAGFELRLNGGTMVAVRGLLERRRTTLPFSRIQAVRFVEGLFRQPLRRGAILVESVGVGDEQGSGSTAIHPLIHRGEVAAWLGRVLPSFGFADPDILLRGRALVRSLAWAVAPILAVFSFAAWTARPEGDMLVGMSMIAWMRRAMLDSQVSLWWVMMVIAAAQGFMAWLRWRSAGLGLLDDRIVVRTRRIARQTSIIPSHRIQSMSVSQGPVQRMASLCTLQIVVASGRSGLTLRVPDLRIEDAEAAESWFRRRIRQVRTPR